MDAPDAPTLARLYLDEKLSLAGIGRLYGVHRNQVRRWLLRASIPTRSVSEGTSLAQRGKKLNGVALEAARRKAAHARTRITAESRAKQAEKMRGRTPHNKGKKWTEAEREKHMQYRATPEYRKMLSERQKGEKANNWRGGQTDEETRRMQGMEWRQRRKECYERDGWTCQECGVHCTSKGKTKIQCHHIIRRRDGGTDDLENLVTLCMSCHHKRENRSKTALFA